MRSVCIPILVTTFPEWLSGTGPLPHPAPCVRPLVFGVLWVKVGRPQTSSSPPVIFIAGRPKAALLFWFFGDFRCGALLFVVIHVIYNIKIGKNSC